MITEIKLEKVGEYNNWAWLYVYTDSLSKEHSYAISINIIVRKTFISLYQLDPDGSTKYPAQRRFITDPDTVAYFNDIPTKDRKRT